MSVRPLRDHLVVSRHESAKKTASGLYVPETVEDKVSTGTVTAVGSGRIVSDGTVVPLEVKVGDKVAFNKNMATELKVDGEVFFVLREDMVFCVV